jgi:hypothetical protein
MIKNFGKAVWDWRFYILSIVFLILAFISIDTTVRNTDEIIMVNGMFACLIIDYIKTRFDEMEKHKE